MTRYARSGSSQKHKKMPGDATPWSEFSKERSGPSMKKRGIFKTPKKIFHAMKKEKNSPNSEITVKNEPRNLYEKADCKNELFDKQNHSVKREQTEQGQIFSKMSEQPPEDVQGNQELSSQSKVGNHLSRKGKRALLMKEKSWRNKSMNDNSKEEKGGRYQKRKTNKPCFNCRKIGHLLADCPEKSSGAQNQAIGICFKCGAVDHTSYKCPDKVAGFPFAKCFICKEQGHISRDCPQNTHGVYVKGGQCNHCGNVNHLKKDCPLLLKKAKEESFATVHTIKEEMSVDEEVTSKPVAKPKAKKKTKIVKF